MFGDLGDEAKDAAVHSRINYLRYRNGRVVVVVVVVVVVL